MMFQDQDITRRQFILLGSLGVGAAALDSVSDLWIRTAIGQEAAPAEAPDDFARRHQEQSHELFQAEVIASKRYLRRVPYEERKEQGLLDEARVQAANMKMQAIRAQAKKLWNQFWEKGDLHAEGTQELAYRTRAILEIALGSDLEDMDVLEDMAQIILASNPPNMILSYERAGRRITCHSRGPNRDLFIPLMEVREKQWKMIHKSDEAGDAIDFRIARNVSYDMLCARGQAHISDSRISLAASGEILNWRIDHAEEGRWEAELPYMLHWLANIEAGKSFPFGPPLRFWDVLRHYDRNKYQSQGREVEARYVMKRKLDLRRYFGLHHITTRVPALGNKTGLELIHDPRNPDLFRIPPVRGSWDWAFANENER